MSSGTGATDELGDAFFSTERTGGREAPVELPVDSYTSYLYALDDPKVADYRDMTYEEFTADRYRAPFLRDLLAYWAALYAEPFVGVTADGVVVPDLYPLPDVEEDPAAQQAAEAVLALLDEPTRERYSYPIDAPEWRAWSNPEFVVHRVGLRLEDESTAVVDAVLALVRASLSPEGYTRVREAMELNAHLGELTGLPNVMNERSYWASMFGSPSSGGAWGWQLQGHHVAVSFVSVAGRQVVAPVFLGAEPALAEGDRRSIFAAREEVAVALASSLSDEQRAQAVVYASVLDPAMPPGRVHPADERHLAGAFRDNRVIPYEGIPASALTETQRGLLREIVEDFHLLLRPAQRQAAMRSYDAHLADTWFCWYGATDGSSPFYLRVQSPVVLAELDHHAGVWLTNTLPARFHVHTTLRLPNGNDYGRAYLAQLAPAED